MVKDKATLSGKVALITGGGTGIGAAIAQRFVEEGARVCITGRRKGPLDAVLRELPPGTAAACTGDVSNIEDVGRMVRTALDLGGKLDVLVNNAGITKPGPVTEVDPAVWHQTLAINLTGPFLTMRAVIPHLVDAGGGSIINISSVGGIRAIPKAPAYCASKAGLIHLSRQVALDYGSKGIRCNVVCPGHVRTEMSEHQMDIVAGMMGTDKERIVQASAKRLPLGRISVPREITGICVYLASDDSAFMTGTTLVIDGGSAVVDVGTMPLQE